jgi:CRISPR-associated protein Csm5
MKYQVTCITPTLVGDGHKLSPIDYMVWKDQVNILDQNRIFKLLSKGPRLDGYLLQLKKATKLDFASWGGFAQNFAGRRIPFEHAAYAAEWNKTSAEYCAIPTFSSGATGPYLPGAALKGALRTGLLVNAWKDSLLADLPPRRPGEFAEKATIGSRTRSFLASDSGVVPDSTFKIYMVKTATMQGTAKLQLGWKPIPNFAEMAVPGSVFEGNWRDDREHHGVNRKRVFGSANDYASKQLAAQRKYAEFANLPVLLDQIQKLEARLEQARATGSCILVIGWGGGFVTKSAVLDTANPEYRKILQSHPFYERAIKSGLPFPKTRRIVYQNNQPATLAGWVELRLLN